MSIRTDLAIESSGSDIENLPSGVKLEIRESGSLKIEHVIIENELGAKNIGKPMGNYITINLPAFASNNTLTNEEYGQIAKEISTLLPKEGTVLIVGLGNLHITPDAIGPKAADLIIATRHMYELDPENATSFRSVAAVSPGVLGQTGVEAAEIVESLVDSIKPAAVIAVDALAAHSVTRLGNTLQIADSGISPGAGVQNRRKELSSATLGIPVIAVGIPTVVDGAVIASELSNTSAQKTEGEAMMVTPRDVDLMVERGAYTVAMAINLALQDGLSQEDINYLIT